MSIGEIKLKNGCIDLSDPNLNKELTEEDVHEAVTFYYPDEEIAVKLLRHIKRLEKRIEVLEDGR